MAFPFPPNAPRLVTPVTVVGPRRSLDFRCTLDTGSELTVLPALGLRALGFDLSRPDGWTNFRGVTGRARVPLIRIPAITAFGRLRTDLLIAAHDFPPGTQSDGLLGLDFFRGFVLTLDFVRGRISLRGPKSWWQFWK